MIPTEHLLSLHAAPTMHDVARIAGVSIKSVSRVINAEPHVSDRLRQKVEAAIAQLGYVPDIAARSLAGQRSFVIGVLLDNPSPHYSMELVTGAYQACRERQYNLQFDNIFGHSGPADAARQIDSILRSNRTDGFILTPPLSDEPSLFAAFEQRGIPYVRVAPVSGLDRAPGVAMDDRAAGAEVADYLWRRGHRHLAYVNGNREHAAVMMRRQGFFERLQELQPDVIISEAQGDFLFEGGIKAGRELLATLPKPTAVFTANDDTAAGVMVAASQLGLKVPRDLSIVGFDDSWVARSIWPFLTTVRQPIRDLGYAAAQILIEQRGQPSREGHRLRILQHALVERDSVTDAV